MNGKDKFVLTAIVTGFALGVSGLFFVSYRDKRHCNQIDSAFEQAYSDHLGVARNLLSKRDGLDVSIDHKFTHLEKEYLLSQPITFGSSSKGEYWFRPR